MLKANSKSLIEGSSITVEVFGRGSDETLDGGISKAYPTASKWIYGSIVSGIVY